MYHIVTECPIFAQKKDGLCAQIHFNPLNAELNPICYLLALLGAHHFLHVSRIRVKICKETGVKLDDELWYDHVPK